MATNVFKLRDSGHNQIFQVLDSGTVKLAAPTTAISFTGTPSTTTAAGTKTATTKGKGAFTDTGKTAKHYLKVKSGTTEFYIPMFQAMS